MKAPKAYANSVDRPVGPIRDEFEESPGSEGRQVGSPGTVVSVVFLLALIAVAVWQFGGVADDGQQIQVLNPNLALVWRVLIITVLTADILLVALVWWADRWTPALAAANLLANTIGVVVTVVPLVQGDLLVNDVPQQLAGVFDGAVDWSVPSGTIAAIVIVWAIWDGLHGVRRAGFRRS